MDEIIKLIRPDDWHLHLRDGDVLKDIVHHSSARFSRAIIMPNLLPPVTTTEQARAYQQRILEALPEKHNFMPLMTLYLTDNTAADEIRQAHKSGIIKAVKYYPAGATTNSDSGVTDLNKCYPVFEVMQELGMPLLLHGEVTDSDIDIFDREKVFIDRYLTKISNDFPDLKIVLEHITTADAVSFINESAENLAATITVHHLLFNRNQMLAGGIKPHYYCLPILKRNRHQQALIKAATSASEKYFSGTDSAPHASYKKESNCGCAGIYSSHAAVELYTEVFYKADSLDNLEAFCSLNGPRFYGLEPNKDTICLIRQNWQVPDSYPFAKDMVIPLYAGQTIQWKLYEC